MVFDACKMSNLRGWSMRSIDPTLVVLVRSLDGVPIGQTSDVTHSPLYNRDVRLLREACREVIDDLSWRKYSASND